MKFAVETSAPEVEVSATRMIAKIFFAAVLFTTAGGIAARAAQPDAATLMQRLDQDGDDVIELVEAQKGALKHFERLDVDHDGTITRKEAEVDHVGDEAFAAADADHDGTVDKFEFAEVMKKVFQAADADHDGKVTVDELNTPSGRTLAGMME